MKKLTSRYPVDLEAWRKLRAHFRESAKDTDIAGLFAKDKRRFEKFSLRFDNLVVDYSRQRVAHRTRQHLIALARQANVEEARDAMFAGELINNTEQRSVLHTALRGGPRFSAVVAGERVSKSITRVREQMLAFVDGVLSGGIRGAKGHRFTDVINVGIGGSDLGIAMAVKALAHVAEGLRVHTVSNVDGTQMADLAQTLDPQTTLVVICSKTFTTLETMSNANLARDWIAGALGEGAVGRHFAAASTNHEAMNAFGVHPHYRFGFWDWVGGRYSLWSSVGLSIALGVGRASFESLLAGARAMDRHFLSAPLPENAPVLLALLAIWNNNFLGASSHAILPYDNRLDRFPAYLQQLQMESNGKSVRRDGKPVKATTGQVIWGEAGSNAQHSFYQLLHQGTSTIPADFILPVRSSGATQAQQDLAIANCLAQSDALMLGFSREQAAADLRSKGLDAKEVSRLADHKVHPGNRPSTVILLKALTPFSLGQLVALYEHKVFVEGVILGINSFDQWGVELGKQMASALTGAVTDPKQAAAGNPSTFALLSQAARWRDS
ncbi:MAG: glucose-6-phosphate isomerase [Pseudomonadota bacterium]